MQDAVLIINKAEISHFVKGVSGYIRLWAAHLAQQTINQILLTPFSIAATVQSINHKDSNDYTQSNAKHFGVNVQRICITWRNVVSAVLVEQHQTKKRKD